MAKKVNWKKLLLVIGLIACGYVIGSILVGAPWVFRVQMALKRGANYVDADEDGKPEYVEYFDKGKLVRSGWDLNKDGVMDVWSHFDDLEHLRLMEADFDFDTTIDYRESWSDGECLWIERDSGPDKKMEKMECPKEMESDVTIPPIKGDGENSEQPEEKSESKSAETESVTDK